MGPLFTAVTYKASFSPSVMYSCITDLRALAQNENAKCQVVYAKIPRITQTLFPG